MNYSKDGVTPVGESFQLEKIIAKAIRTDDVTSDTFGGVITQDFIQIEPISAIFFALGFLLNGASSDLQRQIMEFADRLTLYHSYSVTDILSFKSRSRGNGINTEWISHENGQVAMEEIEKQLEKLIKLKQQVCNK